jgi:hypothetical protein
MGSLKLKAMRHMGDPEPLVVDDYSLIIIEKDGIPVAVAMDMGNSLGDASYVGHVRDRDFNAMLQQLGIDKTVIVEEASKLLLPTDALTPAESIRGL